MLTAEETSRFGPTLVGLTRYSIVQSESTCFEARRVPLHLEGYNNSRLFPSALGVEHITNTRPRELCGQPRTARMARRSAL
jgi:hypothetical protein